MEDLSELEQFQLLERKIDTLLELVNSLKKENAALAGKAQAQEEKLAELSGQVLTLKAGRDKAGQQIMSLLQRIEQSGL